MTGSMENVSKTKTEAKSIYGVIIYVKFLRFWNRGSKLKICINEKTLFPKSSYDTLETFKFIDA